MKLMWLSFVGDGEFLGGCFVRAVELTEAIRVAHALGINPGGEVMAQFVDDDVLAAVPEKYIERLLTKDEIAALDEELKQAAKGGNMEGKPTRRDTHGDDDVGDLQFWGIENAVRGATNVG